MPLADAHMKVWWANKQLNELERLCAGKVAALKRTIQYPKIVCELPKLIGDLFAVPRSTMPYLSRILTGQVVNGLRSALDYAVAALAVLDSGHAKRRTQFPVECCAKGFDGRRASCLAGLNPAHQAVIERLQPYNGCGWTKRMAALSNLDKHNALVPLTMDFLYSGAFSPIKSTKRCSSRYKVGVKITPTVNVGLGEEFELIQAVREIYSGVTLVLQKFDAEFK